ncbi:polysaccharide biosynthesis C-terminal domain-containing protein [Halopseudomonas aestusnigri]|uniref:polysaccharide biosynthesis C-terminal domain-containing protein n=1 Tax=Halopseudomonas aestusnigri TaxID=857252 RepID=UPI0030C67C4F
MTPFEYGVLARWLTDLNYFGLFLVFGLDNSILYYSKSIRDYSENAIRNLLLFVLIGLLLVLGFWLAGHLNWYVFSLVVSIVFFAIYQSMNAYNQLQEMYFRYGVFILLRPLLLLSALTIFALTNDEKIGANEVVAGYSIAGLLLSLLISCATLAKAGFAWPKKIMDKSYILYGGKSMFNTLLAITLYTSTVYCVDFLINKEAVAYFFVAAAVAKLAWVLPDAVGNVMYPRFLKINKEYKKSVVMNEAYGLARIVMALNFVAVIVFALAGDALVGVVFGKNFVEDMSLLIIILLVGNQGMVMYKILGRYLASINQWSTMHIALGISATLNVTLNFLLIPLTGLIGAAIATSIAFWVCGLIVTCKVPGAIKGFFGVSKLVKV